MSKLAFIDQKPDQLLDLFAGCGGSGGGLLEANEILGREVEGTFVNHWDRAIEIHKANYPSHRHLREDIFLLNPEDVFAAETDCSLLWASPSCTHFSVARGAACVSEQGRSHAFTVTDWVSHMRPEAVICENVKEFRSFGPVIQKRRKLKSKRKGELMWARKNKAVKLLGRGHARRRGESEADWSERMVGLGYTPYMAPDPDRAGEYFDKWIAEMEDLGYHSDHRLLVSADYGDPTIRTRLFMYFVRKDSGKRIVWPNPTHSKDGEIPGKMWAWPTARKDVIDWTIKGTSVFTRDKALVDSTLRRLAIGLVKFGMKHLLTSAHSSVKAADYERRVHDPDEPLKTLTGKGERGVAQAETEFLVPNFGERSGQEPRTHSLDKPTPAVTSHGAGGLVQPALEDVPSDPFVLPKDQGHQGDYVRNVDTPLGAVTTKPHEVVAAPYLTHLQGQSTAQDINDPVTALTGCQKHYVAQPEIGDLPALEDLAPPLDGSYIVPKDQGRDKRAVKSVDDPVPALTTEHRGEMPVSLETSQMIDHIRGQGRCSSVDDPSHSPTAGGQHQALAEAFMMAIDQTGGGKNHGCYPADSPVRTIVTKNNASCIELELDQVSSKFLKACDTKGVDASRATAFLKHLIAELHKKGRVDAKPWIYVYYGSGSEGMEIDKPLPTCRTKASNALVYPVVELDGQLLKIDLFYRMLTHVELQRAMGFPDDMDWAGCTSTNIVKAIGNSVSRGVARALGLSWYSQQEDIRPFVEEIYAEKEKDGKNKDNR